MLIDKWEKQAEKQELRDLKLYSIVISTVHICTKYRLWFILNTHGNGRQIVEF